MPLRLLIVGAIVGATVSGLAATPVGRRSGAHFNPAVSLFMALRRTLPVHDLVGYVASQLVGSLAGVLAARLVWRARLAAVHGGVIQPEPGWSVLRVATSEMLCTVLLLLTLAWAIAKPRGRLVYWVNAAVVAGLICATGSRGGGSFNPARNFGPQIVMGEFRFFWTYLLAPLAGSLLVALVLHGRAAAVTHKLCAYSFDDVTQSVSRARGRS